MVGGCLVKNPAARQSASGLLSSPFFRTAKSGSYLVGTVLKHLPPLTQRQERRKRASLSLHHDTMDSWDFSQHTPPLSAKKSPSVSQSSPKLPDEVLHAADPVFELDEDQGAGKGQTQDDSEESSSGPATPGPTTPVLAGLSSPPKKEATNPVVCVSPEDGPKPGLGYNPPPTTTTAPIPARVTHTRNAPRSAPGSPTHSNDAPAAVPHSAPPDKTSQGSKFWHKLTKRGSTRERLNAALDKTDTLVRVVSAGFSSRSSRL